MNVYFQSFHPEVEIRTCRGRYNYIYTREEQRPSLLYWEWSAEFPYLPGIPTKLESSWSQDNSMRLEVLPRLLWPGVRTHHFYKYVFIFKISLALSPSHLSEKQGFGICCFLLINSIWKYSFRGNKALLTTIISPKPAIREHNMVK